jgi:O-antigen/teichoic acid export membrane protein
VRWLAKGFWAVADQGLFASSNFSVNVLLARWLSPHDYGGFAVVYTVLLLLVSFHTGTLTDPMLIFGPGKYRERLSEYLSILLSGHLYLAALISLLLLVISLGIVVAGLSTLSITLLSLVLAGPFILLLYLMRRACYARLKPSLAASGGVLYLVLNLVGIYTLYRLGALSAASGFGVMGLSSLVASMWLAVLLGMRPSLLKSTELTREAFEDHWRYGRWGAAGHMIAWAPGNIYFLLLPIWGGLGASASLKALLNLVVPIQHANMALSVLLLTALSSARETARFDTLVRFALMCFVLGSLVYWLLVGLFHEPLINLLYGGKFRDEDDLLWLLGLVPIGAGVEAVLGAALRIFGRPDQIVWAYVWSTAVALTLGLITTLVWGLVGAVVGLLASSVVVAGAMVYYYASHEENHEGTSRK